MKLTTRFCLVRHGETDWNAERRYQGQLDIGLNATGEAQARALAAPLAAHDFAAVYASDLTRAWRTAQLAVAGLSEAGGDDKIAVSPALTLRERHYGVFQGLTVAEASTVHPHAHAQYSRRDPEYDFETGESLLSFARRVVTGIETLAQRHAGQTVLAFTHGGVLDVIYRRALGRDLSGPRDFSIPNAGINWLRCDDAGWHIDGWAERGHLDAMNALEEIAV